MTTTNNAVTENEPAIPGRRRWIFAGFAQKGVWAALALSLLVFAVYLGGSMPDPGFSDRILFLLLRLLRYSSMLLCAFSLFAMGFSIHRLAHHLNVRNILVLWWYFFTALVGAGFAMLNSMVIAVTGGHG